MSSLKTQTGESDGEERGVDTRGTTPIPSLPKGKGVAAWPRGMNLWMDEMEEDQGKQYFALDNAGLNTTETSQGHASRIAAADEAVRKVGCGVSDIHATGMQMMSSGNVRQDGTTFVWSAKGDDAIAYQTMRVLSFPTKASMHDNGICANQDSGAVASLDFWTKVKDRLGSAPNYIQVSQRRLNSYKTNKDVTNDVTWTAVIKMIAESEDSQGSGTGKRRTLSIPCRFTSSETETGSESFRGTVPGPDDWILDEPLSARLPQIQINQEDTSQTFGPGDSAPDGVTSESIGREILLEC